MQLEVSSDGRRFRADISLLMHNVHGTGRCDGTSANAKWEAVARCFSDVGKQLAARLSSTVAPPTKEIPDA